MKRYCDMKGLKKSMVRFRFYGEPVKETDTPIEHDMEDEDTIDVFQQQRGPCTVCTEHFDFLEEPSEESTVERNQVDSRGQCAALILRSRKQFLSDVRF